MHSKKLHARQSRSRWWFARMRQVVDDADPGPASDALNADG
jgi:hypothetical protein